MGSRSCREVVSWSLPCISLCRRGGAVVTPDQGYPGTTLQVPQRTGPSLIPESLLPRPVPHTLQAPPPGRFTEVDTESGGAEGTCPRCHSPPALALGPRPELSLSLKLAAQSEGPLTGPTGFPWPDNAQGVC